LASHLTVTSGVGIGIASPRPLNGQSAGEAGDDDFAALLGLASGHATAPGSAKTGPVDAEALVGLALDGNAGGSGQQPPENPDTLAGAIYAVLPFDTTVPAPEAKPLLEDLLGKLSDLKTKLEAGEELDGEFLAELNAQLDALGEALGIDLSALPALDRLSALLGAPVPDDASLKARLTGGVAPIANLLIEGKAVEQDAAALAKTVGEKLAALVNQISNGQLDAGKLTELGLTAETEVDPELEAAIAKLLATSAKVEAGVTTPVLAKPELQLSEPVLTGRGSAEAAPAAETSLTAEIKPVEAQADPGTTSDGGKDDKPADTKPLMVAANGNEIKVDTQAAAQPQQAAARVDMVAAPRVVQTGYQTSQQQLNLPQIAFELARQTMDGNTRFQIRLDPAELGRIDVQLDIDTNGQVNARLVVEKAETLDLMQRDQRGLEKALQQAGLDSAKTNLEFSLKQNNGGDAQQQGRNGNGRHAPAGNANGETAEVPPTINLYRASLSASGVNIIA
jgi:flagellar hook-length control protein FliK